jgi:hypothetical protein
MLTPQDDLIGHQLPTTFDQIDNSDPAWMERLWYTGHPVPGGEVMFDIGLGYHPNRNVMDVFAGVAVPGRQWNFRASRRLRGGGGSSLPGPLTTTVGPLAIEVREGLRHHRLVLGANPSSLRFEIDFHATLNPHEETAHLRRRDGRVTENMARAQQMGRYVGWLEYDGKRLPVDGWLGQRDHSWGVRAEMRTDETAPPLTYYPPFFYCWTTVQFKDRGLVVFFKERAPGEKIYLSGEEVRAVGSKASSRDRLVDVQHDARWHDDVHGQSLDSIEFSLSFASGERRKVQVRTLPTRYFLKGGLYGGLDGWFHGDDRGTLHTAHDTWDLNDAATRRKVRTLADQVVEVRDGNEVGYGIIEYGVGKGYALYEAVQQHPPI